jgi:predicted esterase YcpF (UPF0227 family)
MSVDAPSYPKAPATPAGSRMIYLHGFRSSPQSFKAQWLAKRMNGIGRGANFSCPQLPASPREAVEMVRMQFDLRPEDTLVGSSLGGYYATWLAERYDCRAVLLNPAVDPAKGLAAHVGTTTMFHFDLPFEFRQDYLFELRELEVPMITFASRYFLIAATGDEVLDWRHMVAHYQGARMQVIEGSDHGLSDFDDYGDQVLEFAGFR